ncbi:translation initiation factor eIF-2B subunit gamma isoform X2 [Rhodamnia argentea]|uniref:Translation initiation factor eIF2B subunit gamma n=1 Tax=Rhodamnia argentea TaxID=178133 RepID=A0ABM3HH97_9MYRT|nr:translation initiation factor eIF-2B subunit gamma isoform X2 [Rhodamnia argentea]
MDFQVVVLAGGFSKKLVPLVSKEVPKALLPVANRPVLSYVLELLEQSNLKDLIVVVEGEHAALLVGGWISGAYVDRLHVEVAAVPEDIGTAGALRAIAHHLTAKDILVVSGDLVSDVPPGAVAAAHRRHNAVVTAMLCSAPVSGPAESGSSGGKDKTKKAGRYNLIGLDRSKQFLLYIATGAELENDLRIQKSILRAVGEMEIRADLIDAHLYAFKRTVLQEILHQKDTFQSLKEDLLPYLVRSQLVIGEVNHLSGYSFSAHNNIIHPSAELGSKTTVGPHCMLGEGSQMGDKCSVKRSVIGRHCRIGSNVKIVNSIIMNHVTIGDGCSIQGSVVCSNVQLQERVVLKDCQVGAGFVVIAGGEYKGESLAKKEK